MNAISFYYKGKTVRLESELEFSELRKIIPREAKAPKEWVYSPY